MNPQIFMFFFSFLKEIFFDKKEEADFSSKEFKPKRWVAFLFTVFTTCLSIFLSIRIYKLANAYNELEEQNVLLNESITQLKADNKNATDGLAKLQTEYLTCMKEHIKNTKDDSSSDQYW